MRIILCAQIHDQQYHVALTQATSFRAKRSDTITNLEYDVLVIGGGKATPNSFGSSLIQKLTLFPAGISGIAFARFYLDIHPAARLALIEEDSCVGGVWNSSEPQNLSVARPHWVYAHLGFV